MYTNSALIPFFLKIPVSLAIHTGLYCGEIDVYAMLIVESCPGAFAAPEGLTLSKLRETSTTEKLFCPRQTKTMQAFWLPPFAD